MEILWLASHSTIFLVVLTLPNEASTRWCQERTAAACAETNAHREHCMGVRHSFLVYHDLPMNKHIYHDIPDH